MATPTLFEIQCALMSGVADHASRKNQQISKNMGSGLEISVY